MKIKKTLIIIIASLLLMLTACSSNDKSSAKKVKVDKTALKNLNDSGMPIVKKPLKLDFFTGKSLTNVNADWNDLFIWNKYKDMTNIDINWTQVPGDSLDEKRNLALAGGNLPDVFYASRIPNTDLLKYGSQGTFLPLNDLIDKYAPNFKRLLDENPSIKKSITFPDGNIYSLPNLYDPNFTSLLMNSTPWVNKKWLDELGMDMPATTEEFYDYLKAIKGKDLNHNGKMDEVPFGTFNNMSYLIRWLRGSYGIGDRGVNYIDLDPKTKKVRFYDTTDRYKELLQYVNKLYSEGLINQNAYTMKINTFLANAAKGMYGSTVWYSPSQEFGKVGKEFEGGLALKGPHGDQLYADVSNPVAAIGQFAITSKNPNPAATIRWLDYFYGDEGTKFFYTGVEGKTYKKTDDRLKYLDKITNNPDGSTMNEELVKYLAWVGSSPASIIKQKYFQGTESSPTAIAAGKKLKPFFIDEVWPPEFTYTKEEGQKIDALSSDIEKYVDEMTDKFITGKVPFSEWDKYVKQLKDMGLKDYIKIQQAAYERYKGK